MLHLQSLILLFLVSSLFRSKDYRKVPIATIDETPFFGSDKIVNGLLENDAVRKRLQMKWGNNLFMNEFDSSDSAVEWIAFAKEELAPLLYPNMCRTWSDAYAAFDYVNQQSSFSRIQRIAIRNVGSFAMYLAASRVKSTLSNLSCAFSVCSFLEHS